MTKKNRNKAKQKPKRIHKRSKLNDKLIKKFCRLVRQGLPVSQVCNYLCIRPATYYNWLRLGELYLDGAEDNKEHELFGRFVLRVNRALAQYAQDRIDKLHSSNTWVRDMAILDRRFRTEFGRNDPSGGAMEDYDPDERYL